jgi:predicted RNase H-like HicB family nuclease
LVSTYFQGLGIRDQGSAKRILLGDYPRVAVGSSRRAKESRIQEKWSDGVREVYSMSQTGGEPGMKTAKFTYWQDGDYYLGFLNDYPDYQTQGMSKEELVNNLRDLLADLESGEVPYIRKVEELLPAE